MLKQCVLIRCGVKHLGNVPRHQFRSDITGRFCECICEGESSIRPVTQKVKMCEGTLDIPRKLLRVRCGPANGGLVFWCRFIIEAEKYQFIRDRGVIARQFLYRGGSRFTSRGYWLRQRGRFVSGK